MPAIVSRTPPRVGGAAVASVPKMREGRDGEGSRKHPGELGIASAAAYNGERSLETKRHQSVAAN